MQDHPITRADKPDRILRLDRTGRNGLRQRIKRRDRLIERRQPGNPLLTHSAQMLMS